MWWHKKQSPPNNRPGSVIGAGLLFDRFPCLKWGACNEDLREGRSPPCELILAWLENQISSTYSLWRKMRSISLHALHLLLPVRAIWRTLQGCTCDPVAWVACIHATELGNLIT